MIPHDIYGCERSLEEAVKKNPKWASTRIMELETEVERQKDRADMFQQILGGLERTDTADRLAVIADALAGELQYIFDYWQKEEIDIAKAKGELMHKELSWCVERTDLIDRADRLAVVADALAEEVEGLLLSCADDLEAANYWCDRADRAEAKLRELVAAVEWREDIEWFYDGPKHEWFYDGPKHIAGLSDIGWHDIYQYERCRISDAEATYRAALKAAKEVR